MKFIVLTVLISALSCVPTIKFVPEVKIVNIIDFSKYTKKGFMFTTQGYAGKYESVGIIHAIYSPKAHLITIKKKKSDGTVNSISKWVADTVFAVDVIDDIYEGAKSLGANALINLTITNFSETYNEGTMQPLKLNKLSISGFAINRLCDVDKQESQKKFPPVESVPFNGYDTLYEE